MSNTYSVVVFAHNSADKIESCLNSIINGSMEVDIFVIANGCSDSTERVVKELQLKHGNLHLVSIPLADKANAWNHYIHDVAPTSELHFFVDADITVGEDALSEILKTVNSNPCANIVGGVPIAGRDRVDWTQRMIRHGRVSGGLYAMRRSFVEKIRERGIFIPIGFIGEDFLISALAKNLLDFKRFYFADPKLIVESSAGFSFQQISHRRLRDYVQYFRRMVRYRLRAYQLTMLINSCEKTNTIELPLTVQELYDRYRYSVNYYWRGQSTLVDWVAVFIIRNRFFKKRKDQVEAAAAELLDDTYKQR